MRCFLLKLCLFLIYANVTFAAAAATDTDVSPYKRSSSFYGLGGWPTETCPYARYGLGFDPARDVGSSYSVGSFIRFVRAGGTAPMDDKCETPSTESRASAMEVAPEDSDEAAASEEGSASDSDEADYTQKQIDWWAANKHHFMDDSGFIYRTGGLEFYCGDSSFDVHDLGAPDTKDGAPYYYYTNHYSRGKAFPNLSLYVFQENDDEDEEMDAGDAFVGKIDLKQLYPGDRDYEHRLYVVPDKRGRGYGTSILKGLSSIFGKWKELAAPVGMICGVVEISNHGSLSAHVRAGFSLTEIIRGEKPMAKAVLSLYEDLANATEEEIDLRRFIEGEFADRADYFMAEIEKRYKSWARGKSLEDMETRLIMEAVESLLTASDQETFDRLLGNLRELTSLF